MSSAWYSVPMDSALVLGDTAAAPLPEHAGGFPWLGAFLLLGLLAGRWVLTVRRRA